ncbi:hypothetical protein IMSAG185_01336 [Lachnospiraceae bacterium]|nr:hypothetical protein IMSAG185_01336 [Lachnospiraceae bacterium]
MLHDSGQGNGHNGDHAGDQKRQIAVLEGPEHRAFPVNGQADPGRIRNLLKICSSQNRSQQIRTHDADDNGNDLNHAFTPYVADHYQHNCRQGDQPVGGTAVDGRLRKGKSDGDDNRPCHHGREKFHNPSGAEQPDQQGEQQIDESRAGHAEAGVGQKLFLPVGSYGEITAQKRKGGSQKRRHLSLCQKVEQQCAQPRKQQCGRNIQPRQNGNQYGGAEHCKHVLQAQYRNLGCTQCPGIIDAALTESRFFLAHELILL